MLIITPEIVFQLADLSQRCLEYDDLILVGEKQVNNQMIMQVTTDAIFKKKLENKESTYEKIANLQLHSDSNHQDTESILCKLTLNQDDSKELEIQFTQNGKEIPYKISVSENERKTLQQVLQEILVEQ